MIKITKIVQKNPEKVPEGTKTLADLPGQIYKALYTFFAYQLDLQEPFNPLDALDTYTLDDLAEACPEIKDTDAYKKAEKALKNKCYTIFSKRTFQYVCTLLATSEEDAKAQVDDYWKSNYEHLESVNSTSYQFVK